MVNTHRTSDVLIKLAGGTSERVSVGEIVASLHHQAFALLVVVLGLPNCLPMPPPIPLISGLLLGFVAAQIALGMHTPWLPKALLRRTVARADVARAVARALPAVYRLERISRMRLAYFNRPWGMRITGLALFLIAAGLLVAPPFIGQIPLGFAACLVGLGLVERDGVMAFSGFTFGAIGIALSLSFVAAIVGGVASLFGLR
ncbi:exopolysaccharide biosynthesis protein [Camelimonas abortus]|uniref:Exopolysaccharide biosynthesis protein n=1 Tax=Camelimonas abortus TaxID=1017184 RepID=A0ABV7LEI4_9HYPH